MAIVENQTQEQLQILSKDQLQIKEIQDQQNAAKDAIIKEVNDYALIAETNPQKKELLPVVIEKIMPELVKDGRDMKQLNDTKAMLTYMGVISLKSLTTLNTNFSP